MLDQLAQRLGVSTTVAVLILALIVTQLALQIYALVDLARRDAVRGDKKRVWVLVIAFGNLIGAIAYLVVGRTPPLQQGRQRTLRKAAGRRIGSQASPRGEASERAGTARP